MTTLDVTVSMPKPGRTKYSYSLTTREGSAGPLQQEYTIDVNQALVDASCQKIDKALANASGDPDLLRQTLRTQGRLLYRQLLQPPEGTVLELVRQLHESTEPLLVNSNEAVVPWELLHDGEDFLGLKADIGRRSKVNARVLGGRDIGPVRRALVVGDTLGDLPKSREEAEKIGQWLSQQGIACTVLLGRDADLGSIILELTDESEPYDLFHFSGHVSNAPDAMGLLVHRRDLVDEPALRTLAGRGAPPVVFINGCASAGLTMNVCRLFMMMGAKSVVGTRTVVDDESALRFAEAFYSQLRKQVAAGTAARKARLKLSEKEDDAWASFVLHGDPNACISHERRPSPPPEPGPKKQLPFAPDARELMQQISQSAASTGLINSLDLLAGLMETKEIRERSLPRIGPERLNALRATLRTPPETSGTSDPGDTAVTGVDGKINGHRPQVELSDTVARVFAIADEAVAAAGRNALTIDDIATALLRVGGSACEELLEIQGISMDQLLAPPGTEVEAAQEVALRQRVSLDGLDSRAVGVVLCARLLAAARGDAGITSRALLKAFAVTGSEALSRAFEAQGKDAELAMRRLAGVGGPRAGELSTRVAQALQSANSFAGPGERAGEAELLLALLTDPKSSARHTLTQLGVDPEQVVRDLSPSPAPAAPEPQPEPLQVPDAVEPEQD